ncbi:hypothetical protein WG66_003487 [Moniliophthora roreri]|nr:hypothetical protein WG66_003487 [Moniliophthora roreri]
MCHVTTLTAANTMLNAKALVSIPQSPSLSSTLCAMSLLSLLPMPSTMSVNAANTPTTPISNTSTQMLSERSALICPYKVLQSPVLLSMTYGLIPVHCEYGGCSRGFQGCTDIIVASNT